MKKIKTFIDDYKHSLNIRKNDNYPFLSKYVILQFSILFVLISSLFLGMGYLFGIVENLNYVVYAISATILGSFVISKWSYERKIKMVHNKEYNDGSIVFFESVLLGTVLLWIVSIAALVHYDMYFSTVEYVLLLLLSIGLVYANAVMYDKAYIFSRKFFGIATSYSILGYFIFTIYQYLLGITYLPLMIYIAAIITLIHIACFKYIRSFVSSLHIRKVAMIVFGAFLLFMFLDVIRDIYNDVIDYKYESLITTTIKVKDEVKLDNTSTLLSDISDDYIVTYGNGYWNVYNHDYEKLVTFPLTNGSDRFIVEILDGKVHLFTYTNTAIRGTYKVQISVFNKDMEKETTIIKYGGSLSNPFYVKGILMNDLGGYIKPVFDGESLSDFNGKTVDDFGDGEMVYQTDSFVLIKEKTGLAKYDIDFSDTFDYFVRDYMSDDDLYYFIQKASTYTNGSNSDYFISDNYNDLEVVNKEDKVYILASKTGYVDLYHLEDEKMKIIMSIESDVSTFLNEMNMIHEGNMYDIEDGTLYMYDIEDFYEHVKRDAYIWHEWIHVYAVIGFILFIPVYNKEEGIL